MIDGMSRLRADFMIAQIFEEVRLALSQGDADVPTALRNSEPLRKLLRFDGCIRSGRWWRHRSSPMTAL